MTSEAKPFRPLSSMPAEEQEAKSTIHGGRGVKVIPLASGRFSLSDSWSRLISRADVTICAGFTPYDGDEIIYGFSLEDLPSALQVLFASYDFSMPKAWGWTARKEAKAPETGTSLTSSASSSDLGF